MSTPPAALTPAPEDGRWTPPPGRELVLAVDTLVAGVHFPAGTAPEDVGYKSLAVNLSDLAAMGAEPLGAELVLVGPEPDAARATRIVDGFAALARATATVTAPVRRAPGPTETLTVLIAGHLPRGAALLRSGARAGDRVCVTGTLGDAALALAALGGAIHPRDEDLAELRRRLDRPQPRLAAGRALRGAATAAIDLSDGLSGDLGHILAASGVGATLTLAALPVSAAARAAASPERIRAAALSGGDDYELCFTVPADRLEGLAAGWPPAAPPFTVIGTVEDAPGLRCRDEAGRLLTPGAAWQHFR